MSFKSTCFGVAGLAGAILLSGCGGSTVGGTAINPRIRAVDLLNAPPTVNFLINGQLMTGASTFGGSSTYQIIANGDRQVTVQNANSNAVLISQAPLFTLNGFYTVIAYGGATGPTLLVLSDDNRIGAGSALLRFEKVANNVATSADVYVTQPGASLTGILPTWASVSVGSVQKYQAFSAGTYEVRECAAGTQTPFVDDEVTLGGSTGTTLVDDGSTTAFLNLQDQ